VAAVRAADAGEAMGEVAALEIIVDYLGDDWAEEAVIPEKTFVIELREMVEIPVQQIP